MLIEDISLRTMYVLIQHVLKRVALSGCRKDGAVNEMLAQRLEDEDFRGAPEIPININQKVELGFEHNRPCEVNLEFTWSM